MVGAATKDEEPEYEYRIIKSDYGMDSDVGLVNIRDDHNSREHHWVRFPNGDLRSWYLYETIDEARSDEMEAFEMAPRLKVYYRPISRVLYNIFEGITMMTVMLFIWLAIMGLVAITGMHYFDWSIHATTIGSWILSVSFGIFWAFLITSIICYVGHQRYNETPKADQHPREWEHKRIEALRKDRHGWF